jgi:hypothetical protein
VSDALHGENGEVVAACGRETLKVHTNCHAWYRLSSSCLLPAFIKTKDKRNESGGDWNARQGQIREGDVWDKLRKRCVAHELRPKRKQRDEQWSLIKPE